MQAVPFCIRFYQTVYFWYTWYPVLDYIKMYSQIKVFAGKMWPERTFGLRIWSVFVLGVFCHRLELHIYGAKCSVHIAVPWGSRPIPCILHDFHPGQHPCKPVLGGCYHIMLPRKARTWKKQDHLCKCLPWAKCEHLRNWRAHSIPQLCAGHSGRGSAALHRSAWTQGFPGQWPSWYCMVHVWYMVQY